MATLGESRTAAHKWDDGRAPLVMPNATRVGSANCISEGELEADALPPGTAINGFAPDCFEQEDEREATWQKASSIESCGTMRAYAWIIYYLYLNDETRITNFLREWLGDQFDIHFIPQTDVRPAAVILRAETWTVCVFDGTRHFGQLVVQAWYELVAPRDYGLYGTNPLWQGAANFYLNKLIELDVPPTQRITFVGHSFGGAVSSILATMYRSGQPDRTIALLTFGLPKVGDSRMVAIMDDVRQVHVQNDDDIVTVLPPDEQVKTLIALVFGLNVSLLWLGWTRITLPWIQDRSGNIRRAQPTPLDLETWAQMIVDRLNGERLRPNAGHDIDEYWRRINQRCPDAEWPIDQEESDVLKIEWEQAGIVEMGRELYVPDGAVKMAGELLYPGGGVEMGPELLYPGGGVEMGPELLYPGGGVELGPELLYPGGGVELGPELLYPGGGVEIAAPLYETPILEMCGRSTDLPGPSCATRYTMTLNTIYSGIVNTGPQLFFTYAMTGGTTYRLTFTIASNENFTVAVTKGATCPGIPDGAPLTYAAQTRTITPPVNTNLYLLLTSGAGTHRQAYTLQVKTPP